MCECHGKRQGGDNLPELAKNRRELRIEGDLLGGEPLRDESDHGGVGGGIAESNQNAGNECRSVGSGEGKPTLAERQNDSSTNDDGAGPEAVQEHPERDLTTRVNSQLDNCEEGQLGGRDVESR